jgi:UDP-glucose 4-epimerase
VNNIVIGGAGFIGSRLAQKLCMLNESVTVIDDFSKESTTRIGEIQYDPRLSIIDCNLSNSESVNSVASQLNRNLKFKIWHMAANSDIHLGMNNAFIDYRDTLGTTVAGIELAKIINCSQFVFASSSAIYGELGSIAISESNTDFYPISNYGAMKLCSENIIRMSFPNKKTKVRIYRFPNVIGLPLTHGVIHDLTKKLKEAESFVKVLGNGMQQKPFIHVEDLIQGMLTLNETIEILDTFNIGPNDEGATIRELAELLRDALAPGIQLVFGNENRGWVGDVPKYQFDTSKARRAGFLQPQSSHDAIHRVISEILSFYAN